MANNNSNLHAARDLKDDEFYTTYECIVEELSHYHNHFKGKTVLCNCDDPFESNFCKFFLRHFNLLKLKRLICTSYDNSKVCVTTGTYIHLNEDYSKKRNAYVLDIKNVDNDLTDISDIEFPGWLKNKGCIERLKGNGDFRSEECIKYLKEADIVVTNPPFSLFKEIVSLLVQLNKKFLLIGNQNALTYKEIFPLIQNNLVWTGYGFGDMKFRVPQDSAPRATRFWIDELGQKWRSIGNAMWLTNLDNDRRHNKLNLTKHYSPEKYPKYDNYDAINVKRVEDIPVDYYGIMGVPITIINKFNPEQFEIVGEANHGSDNKYDLFKPLLGGKLLFKRILIRHKINTNNYVRKFKILDLFCGAGGFSYGMEKNEHFETIIALDNDKFAGETFRYNFPNCDVVIGDITSKVIKQNIIEKAKRLGVNMIIGGPPCQGYSNKGKKLGLDDPRNFLFREYLLIVQSIKPDVFVIENVKTLLSTSNGYFRDEILQRICELGYLIEYGVLNAADFGVPQSRERAIFICTKNKKVNLPVKSVKNFTTVRDAISDLAYLESGEGEFEQEYLIQPMSQYQSLMRFESQKLFNHIASKHKQIAIDKLKLIPPEKGKECLPAKMLGRQRFKSTWGRLKWDNVSPTIDTRFDAASNGTNNHPVLNRAITPREAARLQSFDDRFIFYGSKVRIRNQIGNAVPPLMAKAIADTIYNELANN